MKLVDTHAHLDEIADCEGALVRAREGGVQAVIGVGADLSANEKILDLAARHPHFVFPALGLHPWRLDQGDLEKNFSLLEKELPGCLALGEVGLDFAIETPREKQEEVLKRLLNLARESQKPVLLHARRAWAEALVLLKACRIEKAVFHWYSGPTKVLREILEAGYSISATPAAQYSERHRRAIEATPLDRLLLETDAPEIYQGQPSEPKDLLTTLRAVSAIKGRDPQEIARQTFLNARRFFNFPGPR